MQYIIYTMLLSSFYSSSYVYKYFINISTLSLYCKCFWLQPVSFLYLVFFSFYLIIPTILSVNLISISWLYSTGFLTGFIWRKVFKNGPSKVRGRHPLKKWSDMVKVVSHKFYLVHSWILCPIWGERDWMRVEWYQNNDLLLKGIIVLLLS